MPQIRRSFSSSRAVLFMFLVSVCFAAGAAASPQSDQDQLFNGAVQSYNQNRFSEALSKFQQVAGAHQREARQYAANIKTYMDAMQVARSITSRNPDELDASSLAYAIQKYQEAIKIKSDGPWHPMDEMQKAAQLKADIERKHAASSLTMDREFCTHALAAMQEHHYKEAKRYACPLANDNPAYSCGGDEAVHMCDQMTELAKIDKTPDIPITKDHHSGSAPTGPSSGSSSSAFDKGKEFFDNNDFDRAREQFRKASVDLKGAADEYVDRISRYQEAMKQANQLYRDSKYDEAEAAFQSAATIKADGPGDPQTQALRMELMVGLDKFYSGDYVAAAQHLEACTRPGSEQQSLARFYLGASKLARFFLSGSEDANLQRDALADMKIAKQAGFKATDQDVSPRILRAYQDLAF